ADGKPDQRSDRLGVPRRLGHLGRAEGIQQEQRLVSATLVTQRPTAWGVGIERFALPVELPLCGLLRGLQRTVVLFLGQVAELVGGAEHALDRVAAGNNVRGLGVAARDETDGMT